MGKSLIISTNSGEFAAAYLAKLRQSLGISDSNLTDQINITIPEDKLSIGIDQMQELKAWSKTRPYAASGKLACVQSAESLTNEAQNSILKLLEEPSSSNNYVLITANFEKLLPTIISRCELIYDNQIKETDLDISDFLKNDQLDRFKYLERFEKIDSSAAKSRTIELFILTLLKYFRSDLLAAIDQNKGEDVIKNGINNIEIVNTTKKMLDAHVPPKSALDFLIVNINIA